METHLAHSSCQVADITCKQINSLHLTPYISISNTTNNQQRLLSLQNLQSLTSLQTPTHTSIVLSENGKPSVPCPTRHTSVPISTTPDHDQSQPLPLYSDLCYSSGPHSPSTPLLDRDGSKGPCSDIYIGHQRKEISSHPSERETACPANNRRDENCSRELCQLPLDGEQPPSTSSIYHAPVSTHNAGIMQPTPLPQSLPEPQQHLSNLFFTPSEEIQNNPVFFPWQPQPVQPSPSLFMPTPLIPPSNAPQHPSTVLERVGRTPLNRTAFTEISSLRHATLMVFPKNEDKKYIHNCPQLFSGARLFSDQQ
ncbi:hypothetical protein FXO38_29485 [Capsicum annuum]|nr:hypothetical protein FXO38_29485 [Capsicum annuum]